MPARSAAPFRHHALLYDDRESFLAAALPFVREGLARREPVLVAVTQENAARLTEALGDDAAALHFRDIAVVGANPARLIPAWQAFVEAKAGPDGAARALGEPIWSGRSGEEIVECQLHEALINQAFSRTDRSSLLCAYDARALDAPVLQEACCSHAEILTGSERRPSAVYRGDDAVPEITQAPLPPPPVTARALGFDAHGLEAVRALVAECADRARLDETGKEDLVLSVHELAVNSVRHAGGIGVLRVWTDGEVAVCEVRDGGHIVDPLIGRHRPQPGQLGGWGLWIANQTCDLVQVRSGPAGTVVRVRRSAR